MDNNTVEKKQTDHTGKVYTKNDWGVDLLQLTVRHRQSNESDKQQEATYYDVPAGATVGPLIITYTTGPGSPFDYWWVKFITATGETYSCKHDFYCSISSDDNGIVNITLDGSTDKMYITFSDSSGCKVSINLDTPDKEQTTQPGDPL